MLLLCALSACASAPLPHDLEVRVQHALAANLVAYPELAGRSFALSVLDEHDVFFQSNFTLAAGTGAAQLSSPPPLPLAYAMQVNPRAFALGIDDEMLRGVLGHELAHSLDYQGRTAAQLLALAPLALFPEQHAWERATDLLAVARGFGPGLLRYRAWQFRVLDDDAVAHKKRVYYGPTELALLMDVKERCPALFRTFAAAPPATAREIATRCP